MEQMTITAKVQIVASDTDKVLLDKTMSVYRLHALSRGLCLKALFP